MYPFSPVATKIFIVSFVLCSFIIMHLGERSIFIFAHWYASWIWEFMPFVNSKIFLVIISSNITFHCAYCLLLWFVYDVCWTFSFYSPDRACFNVSFLLSTSSFLSDPVCIIFSELYSNLLPISLTMFNMLFAGSLIFKLQLLSPSSYGIIMTLFQIAIIFRLPFASFFIFFLLLAPW